MVFSQKLWQVKAKTQTESRISPQGGAWSLLWKVVYALVSPTTHASTDISQACKDLAWHEVMENEQHTQLGVINKEHNCFSTRSII